MLQFSKGMLFGMLLNSEASVLQTTSALFQAETLVYPRLSGE